MNEYLIKISNELSVSEAVIKEANKLLITIKKMKLTSGRRLNELSAACTYLIAKQLSHPINIKELSECVNSDKKHVIKQCKFIKRFIVINNELTSTDLTYWITNKLGLKPIKAIKELRNININASPMMKAVIAVRLAYNTKINKLSLISGLSINGIRKALKKLKKNN